MDISNLNRKILDDLSEAEKSRVNKVENNSLQSSLLEELNDLRNLI